MTPKLRIAAITDEFSPDLAVALDAMQPIGMRGAELRVVGGKNILDLTDDELKRAKDELDARGFEVISIASPLLKCVLPEGLEVDTRFQQDVFASKHTFEDQPRLAEQAFKLAKFFGAGALRRLAADPTQPLDKREHAVSELVEMAKPAAADALRALATDQQVASDIRAAATIGLAQRQGADSVALLSNLVADADPKVRLAAARGLGMVGGDAARSALQARLDAETDPQVREELQRSLARTTN